MNLVGGLYPGLYDWLTEVPVVPVFPPGTCVTSGITVRNCVAADVIECGTTVTACVNVTTTTGTVVVKTQTLTCHIFVLNRVQCDTIECRERVVGCVKVNMLEPPSGIIAQTVCADVRLRYACIAEIDCTMGVTAEVTARTRVTADESLMCCCKETTHG